MQDDDEKPPGTERMILGQRSSASGRPNVAR